MTKIYVCNVNCLQDSTIFEKKFKNISEYRKQKVQSYRFMKDKILTLGAELLLNKVVKEINPNVKIPLEIITGKNHKPYMKNDKEFFYNLSHSGEYVACAVGSMEMGVDIEKIEKFDLNVIKRCFTDNEQNQILFSQKKISNELLFQLWTCKESFVKAIGTGLSMDLLSFEIEVTSLNVKKVIQHYNTNNYYCRTYEAIPGYKITMCHADCNFPDNVIKVELI